VLFVFPSALLLSQGKSLKQQARAASWKFSYCGRRLGGLDTFVSVHYTLAENDLRRGILLINALEHLHEA